MSAIQRMLQYLDKKGISKYRFYKTTGLSNGFLDKGENIGSDKCEIIVYYYQDLNVEWLITGKGPMLKKTKEEFVVSDEKAKYELSETNSLSFAVDSYNRVIAAQDKTIESQAQTIRSMEKTIQALEKLLDPKSASKGATEPSSPTRTGQGQLVKK